jgi:hypothetical protein
MRYFIAFIIVILFVQPSKSQFSVGVDAGYAYNHLNTDISNRAFTKNINKNGYSSGLQINYNISNLLCLQTGIGFLQKNYSYTRTGVYLGVYETFTNSYFQMPINVQLKILKIKKFKLFIKAGIFGAYWAFAKVNGAMPNIFNSTNTIGNDGQIVQYLSLTVYSEKYQFNGTKDNRFEFGLSTGISIYYELNNKYSVFIETSYYQSLIDQQKNYMINQVSKANQTLCFSIGSLMTLPGNKK